MNVINLFKIAKTLAIGAADFVMKQAKKTCNLIKGHAAVLSLVCAGGNISEAAKILDVAPITVARRIIGFQQDRASSIGNFRQTPGPKKRLTDDEQREIGEFTIYCRPVEIGFLTLYWTADIICNVIKIVFEKEVSRSTVKRILAALKISYHKAEPRNIRRDDELIDRWMNILAPELLASDIGEEYSPMFLDESNFTANEVRKRTWGLKGKRLSIPQGDRHSLNVIGSIGIFGESFFLTTKNTIDSAFVIEYLKELHLKYPDKKFAIYLDGAKIHWSKMVNEYVTSQDWLRVRRLPPYAPEINPIELLWADLKNHRTEFLINSNFSEYEEKIFAALKLIIKEIQKLEKYWHAKEIQYIGAAFSLVPKRTDK